MHLKNWSLIEQPSYYWHLAPCYDLISSKACLPHEDESALTITEKETGWALMTLSGLEII